MAAMVTQTILLVAASILLFVSTPTVAIDGQCSSSILQANENAQILTSPNYPNNSAGNLNCQFTINGSNSSLIALSISSFDLQNDTPLCSADNVTIYDGNSTNSPIIALLCGMASMVNGDFKSTGPYLTVAFCFTSSGRFRIEYRSLEKSVICPQATVSASKTEQYITSPDYPNIYPSKMDCQWTITADNDTNVVALKVLDLELYEGGSTNCIYDYVTIYDGPSDVSPRIQLLCGYISNALYVSSRSSMTVAFHSEALFNQRRGFKFQYSSIEKSDSCSKQDLVATPTAAVINSPSSYPSPQPSIMDCEWHILAASGLNTTSDSAHKVVLKVDKFSLAGDQPTCLSDYVKIFDGPNATSPVLTTLCGQHSDGTYTSTKSQMTVVFHSEGGNNNTKGFNFTYYSQNSAGLLTTTQITFLPIIILIFQLLY